MGIFTTVASFVDNRCHCGSLESQRLGNIFITLSTLIDVSDFGSYSFLYIVALCVALRSFSLHQTGSLLVIQ